MPYQQLEPVRLFLATFTISSFAGLAALLRSGRDITLRSLLSAMLNSGLLGLSIGFVWYNYLQGNVWFLMGVSLLAGLGGLTAVDFILTVFRRGGLDIHVDVNKNSSEDRDHAKHDEY